MEDFRIDVSQAVLDDLQERLGRTRFVDDGRTGWDDGVPACYVRELVEHWRTGYDWRAEEARLNAFHQVRGEVKGTAVHAIHERGDGPTPLPLLLAHGYPDSVWRFQRLIPLLTRPGEHGGDPADAFDVIVPSLPGYGWSASRAQAGGVFGWGDLMAALMQELGYDRYGAHGGDWGSTVVELLARSHAKHVVGIHLTDVPFWHGFQPPKDPSPAERKYLDRNETFQREGGAYATIQGTRPLTPAHALHDSPAGLAAWLVEKFYEWSDDHGDLASRFSKDDLLTNAMIYWTTGSITTSFQPYRDFTKAGAAQWTVEGVRGLLGSSKTPAGFALFPADINTPPREWAERFFHVTRWSEMPRGGHFAALEEPELLAAEIRAFFRPLR